MKFLRWSPGPSQTVPEFGTTYMLDSKGCDPEVVAAEKQEQEEEEAEPERQREEQELNEPPGPR